MPGFSSLAYHEDAAAVSLLILLSAGQDTLDLKPSAEGLVEQQPGLEFRDKWEPCQHGHRREDDQSHYVLEPSRECFHGPPHSETLYHWSARL